MFERAENAEPPSLCALGLLSPLASAVAHFCHPPLPPRAASTTFVKFHATLAFCGTGRLSFAHLALTPLCRPCRLAR
jgi:hypothetical protein